MIHEVKMPASIRIRVLRHAIRRAVEDGGTYVHAGPGQLFSLDYAQHVLACLLEAQAGKPCPVSGWESSST